MQRCDNLVDLEKRCKMSIWTQKSALIQLRTSLLKFDDMAEKFENSSVSNFSTKVQTVVGSSNLNGGAFAAVKVDGSVVTWGRAYHGGDSRAVAEQLSRDVQTVVGS